MASSVDPRVPATVLTGFLGSGKTTLLNHILTASHGKKIAIIENEFGDVAIDDKLVASNSKFSSDEEIIEVLNGCICCSVRSDLVAVLEKLAERTAAGDIRLDAIIIETTGMADPAPVAQTFLVHESIKAFARIDGIVTLVDAKHVEQHLDEVKPDGVVNEAAAQVAFADRLLLNKTDLVSEDDLKRVEARLRSINLLAPIHPSKFSEVSVENVLNISGFDLKRALKTNPSLLDIDAAPTKHDTSISSVSLDQSAPRHLRMVQHGELDMGLTQAWLNTLLGQQGESMFRMKGVLSIAHAEERFIYHSVHMVFSGDFAEPWAAGEPRDSKLVFIGKDLDADALAAGFNACLATPDNLAKKAAALRFDVGDEVECNMGSHWAPGTVVALLYRDDGLPAGMVAPYQVELEEEGRLIFAPVDSDCAVRRRGGAALAAHALEYEEVRRQLTELPRAQLVGMLEEMGHSAEGGQEELVQRLISSTMSDAGEVLRREREEERERRLDEVRRRLQEMPHEQLAGMCEQLQLPSAGSEPELVERLVENTRAVLARDAEECAGGEGHAAHGHAHGHAHGLN